MYFIILQTRRGDQDKSKIIFLISQLKHVVTPHYNHHVVMLLLMSQQMFNMRGMLKKDILLCDLKMLSKLHVNI